MEGIDVERENFLVTYSHSHSQNFFITKLFEADQMCDGGHFVSNEKLNGRLLKRDRMN